jgi:hypothetical protein
MLKSRLSFASLIFIGFALLNNIEALGADWKAYGGSDDGVFYYDAENMTHPSKNVVRVHHKVIFSEKGIRGAVKALGKDYENLGHAISLREIDCSEKMIRSLSVIYYSKTGAVLDFAIDYEAEWHGIDPMAIMEGLYQRVCP